MAATSSVRSRRTSLLNPNLNPNSNPNPNPILILILTLTLNLSLSLSLSLSLRLSLTQPGALEKHQRFPEAWCLVYAAEVTLALTRTLLSLTLT